MWGIQFTSATGLAATTPLASGTYRAAQDDTLVSLNLAFAGTSPNGTWSLKFVNLSITDTTRVSQARLTLTTAAPGKKAIALLPNGSRQLTFTEADASSPYLVRGSSNLTNWTTLQTLSTNATGSASYTDTANRVPRYYYFIVPTTSP